MKSLFKVKPKVTPQGLLTEFFGEAQSWRDTNDNLEPLVEIIRLIRPADIKNSEKVDLQEIIDFLNEIFEDYILDIKNNMVKYNAKEVLQEYTQSKTKEVPQYKLIEEIGPAHEPKFKMEVLYQNRVLATAIGTSKKDAEQKCAYEACKKLGVINE